jgi:hypothetical protein
VAEPGVIAVSIPDTEPIVAIAVLELLQVPPLKLSASDAEEKAHIVPLPLMGLENPEATLVVKVE